MTNSQHEPDLWTGRHGPLLITEVGGNHEGNFDYAVRLTRQAVTSGADYVKFQVYTADSLVSPIESPDRHAHFRKFEFEAAQHVELAELCREAGVGYMASVWDLEMLDRLDPYLSIYKVGSGDLTCYPVLEELARRGKPILLSTGLSTLDEVVNSVRVIQAVDPRYCEPSNLALLQCTSMYPIPAREANLRAMATLRDATGLPVGYSDHTIGSFGLIVAAALGARILEFHFTDDRHRSSFRDHQVSLTLEDTRELCEQLSTLGELLGDGVKRPMPSEIAADHVRTFRRGVYCKRPLQVGEAIAAADLVTLRPNHGVDAREHRRVPGSIAARDHEPLQALTLTDGCQP